MILHNVGYDHHHDADFYIDRPEGSGDYLLLILKSDALFTLGGEEVFVPRKSFFLYPPGMPQKYRCVPKHTFSNDWLQFLFEGEEPEWFSHKFVPVAEPVKLEYTEFFSYCIKCSKL